LSIEGGIPGNQQRLVCPNCGKVFFAWRPDDLPGQKVKCYFCKHEFADEAALRPPPPAPIAAATETPAAAPTASVEPAAEIPAAPATEEPLAEAAAPAVPAAPDAEEPPAETG
jgi:hypothetical protein